MSMEFEMLHNFNNNYELLCYIMNIESSAMFLSYGGSGLRVVS